MRLFASNVTACPFLNGLGNTVWVARVARCVEAEWSRVIRNYRNYEMRLQKLKRKLVKHLRSAAFDREMQRVQSDVNDMTEKLRAIQIRKDALSRRSQEASTRQYQTQKVERFIGNLESALNLHRRLGDDGELRTDVDQLRERYATLNEELPPLRTSKRGYEELCES